VYETLAPFLEDRPEAPTRLAARPKLDGTDRRIGLPLASDVSSLPVGVVAALATVLAGVPGSHLVVGRAAAPGSADPVPGRDPAAALRADLPETLVERVSARTVTDPWNWWRTLGILFVPDGVAVDRDLVAIGRASGAREVRTPGELATAMAAGEGRR
jgi:hypothetical protein